MFEFLKKLKKVKDNCVKDDCVKTVPVTVFSNLGGMIWDIVSDVSYISKRLDNDNDTLHLSDISVKTVPWNKYVRVEFKLRTTLGYRKVIAFTDCSINNGDGCLITLCYYDEHDNELLCIEEKKLFNTQPYRITLKNFGVNCSWDAVSIMKAINEVHTLVRKEYNRIENEYSKVEKELTALAHDDSFVRLLNTASTNIEESSQIIDEFLELMKVED